MEQSGANDMRRPFVNRVFVFGVTGMQRCVAIDEIQQPVDFLLILYFYVKPRENNRIIIKLNI